MEARSPSTRLSRSTRLVVQSIEHRPAEDNLMKSQVLSEIGSRFGQHRSFGPQGMLLSSQRVGAQASQRRLFAPRKTFTFHGSRRKTNVSMRTDNPSLGNSLGADTSHRRRLTPGAASVAAAVANLRPEPAGQPAPAATTDPACPAAECVTQQQCGPVAEFAVPLVVPPAATLVQHLISGAQSLDASDSHAATELAGQQDGVDEDAEAARARMTERPFTAREAYLAGRRRARRQRRPKPAAPRPFRKIFFSEREGKWIEHRIFESELQTTNELSGPQPFPKTNAARRRAAPLGPPCRVKGRKTSKMREMLPTAFVKGGEKPDQPCRKIDVTDQLRIELYKRNMPVVPTFYQEHIYKFGKPPFRGNPRTH